MTIPQMVSLAGMALVLAMYAWPYIKVPSRKPPMLRHVANVLAIRDEYPTPEVLAASNALMEALLGIR